MNNIQHLYLIGNGFDRHHSIKSNYEHFKEWLNCHNHALYMRLAQTYELYDCDFWSEFETNLGELPIKSIIHESYSMPFLIESPTGIKTFDCGDIAGEIGYKLKYLFWELQDSFHEWIKNLNRPDASKKIKIDNNNSFFIVFNYTKTLETLYNIDNDHLLYIHGNAHTDDKLIFGHNKTKETLLKNWEQIILERPDIDVDKLSEEVTILYKDTSKIISENQAIWNRLENVTTIHIYGLSISDIDKPYISKIASLAPEATWEISWLTDKDKDRAYSISKQIGLSNVSLIKLNDIILS